MLHLDIDIKAVTTDELVYTLQEVLRKVEDGFRGGNDTREDDTGHYEFDVTGEDAEYVECPHCGTHAYVTDEEETKPSHCYDCGKDFDNSKLELQS